MLDYDHVCGESNRLAAILGRIETVIGVDSLHDRARELEAKVADPLLWDNANRAQETISELSRINSDVQHVDRLKTALDEVTIMAELLVEENIAGDMPQWKELEVQLKDIATDIEQWETKTLLSGPYDHRDAVVSIRSGAGGVDAADWAHMLLRMYLRWAEKHDYRVEIYDISYAEEAGIKMATFVVSFPYAYGLLSVEIGTHRLVRISPFDNQNRRQTSFAEVEVLPATGSEDKIEINESDLRVDVFRSSGPGGQSVNTTDSAVRITHIPTGIVATCQNEKSQLKNKASALNVLSARLLDLQRRKEEEEREALRKQGGTSWGNQMRSYVLHPYQMVKDLRTEYEVSNPTAVLDGDIDEFIAAAIKQRALIGQDI